jgi:hypothetical protein
MKERKQPRGWIRVLAVVGLLLPAAGCDLFDDLGTRFKTCDDVLVTLVNSEQTRSAVNIIGPDEVFGHENLLESGHSRGIMLCLKEGDLKRFRVQEGSALVAAKNCQASRDDYETHHPTVVWTQDGLSCHDW